MSLHAPFLLDIADDVATLAASNERVKAALERLIDALDCPASGHRHRVRRARSIAYAALAGDDAPAPGGACPACGSDDCHAPFADGDDGDA